MNDTLRQREARAYHRSRRRLGLVSGICSLAVVGAAVAAAGPLGGWWAVAILGPGLWLVELPFGYAGYRLSRGYGLSRQTAGGWLGDRLKGAAVGAVLGAVVAAGLIACQRAWPGGWPLAAWLAMVAFTAALAVLWPLVLLPIFLSSEPLTDGEVAEELRRTAREAHVQVREQQYVAACLGYVSSAGSAYCWIVPRSGPATSRAPWGWIEPGIWIGSRSQAVGSIGCPVPVTSSPASSSAAGTAGLSREPPSARGGRRPRWRSGRARSGGARRSRSPRMGMRGSLCSRVR